MTKLEKFYYDKVCDFENENLMLRACIKQKDVEIGKLKSNIDELSHNVQILKREVYRLNKHASLFKNL